MVAEFPMDVADNKSTTGLWPVPYMNSQAAAPAQMRERAGPGASSGVEAWLLGLELLSRSRDLRRWSQPLAITPCTLGSCAIIGSLHRAGSD